MKIRIVERTKKTVINEGATIDKKYLKDQGIILLKELGSGMFGVVYEVIADVGDGNKRYALKFVSDESDGYSRERANYKNIKQFVELADIRQDAEAVRLGKILPVIYSVSEHAGGLYIIMEKLIPLSETEKKLFMSELSALAYSYSQKRVGSHGSQLIDYITDRDGKIGVPFDKERVVAVLNALVRSDEYKHTKGKQQQLAMKILDRSNSDDNTRIIFSEWNNSSFYDDIKYTAIKELYALNGDFKTFMNGIANFLVTEYREPDNPNATLMDDGDLVGLLMNSIFDIIFTQKYPMKYTDNPNLESPYETGYGQSSSIYDADIAPNPKLREEKSKYSAKGVKNNPAQPEPSKINPTKYPFDAIISTIRRLGRDWNIKGKDMHNANVMKRADGQFVIADIGLFNTRTLQSMKSGIFEGIRKIKVKII
jgi:serine/threonine protein kinase